MCTSISDSSIISNCVWILSVSASFDRFYFMAKKKHFKIWIKYQLDRLRWSIQDSLFGRWAHQFVFVSFSSIWEKKTTNQSPNGRIGHIYNWNCRIFWVKKIQFKDISLLREALRSVLRRITWKPKRRKRQKQLGWGNQFYFSLILFHFFGCILKATNERMNKKITIRVIVFIARIQTHTTAHGQFIGHHIDFMLKIETIFISHGIHLIFQLLFVAASLFLFVGVWSVSLFFWFGVYFVSEMLEFL